MPEFPHLPHAPIREAIIDIRVKARSELDVETFMNLGPELKALFPMAEQMRGSQVHFQINPMEVKTPEIQDLGLQGYFFRTEDKSTVCQFRVDGFTLNKLTPYTSWEELKPLSMRLWEMYQTLAKPEAVTRIALRYINDIKIEQRGIDFDEYFTAAPPVPKELPQSISRFLYQTTIVVPEDQSFVNITQAFEQPRGSTSDTSLTIILDIEAYKDISVAPNDTSIFEHFAKLRELKNKAFFYYLTQKTIGLFV